MVTLLFWLGCATPDPDDGARDTAPSEDRGADTDDTADTGPDPDTLDQDGDGYRPLDGDCDDLLPHVYPGAPDYCDGLDQDCDGEPIPAGSCGVPGDARAMWRWSSSEEESNFSLRGLLGDADGDGRADVVGYNGSGVYGVLYGASLDPRSAALDPPGIWTSDPTVASPAGDTNADGYADAWRTRPGNEYHSGQLWLQLGSTAGLDDTPDVQWNLDYGLEHASNCTSADFDGDDATDVLVGWHDALGDGVLRVSLLGGERGFLGGGDFDGYPATEIDFDGWTAWDLLSLLAVGDLDGDGAAEMAVRLGTGSGKSDVLAVISGLDLTLGGAATDLAQISWYTDDTYTHLSPATLYDHAEVDLDDDGLDDLLMTVDEPEPDEESLVWVSGGIPEGEIAGTAHARVRGIQYGTGSALEASDVDDDGVGDPMLYNNCILPSTRLAGGGTFEYADVVGPCAQVNGAVDVFADMTGDGLPEWVIDDRYGADGDRNRVLIIEGFPIPWDDPTKW